MGRKKKIKRNKYRYIFCGVVQGSDPISNFRLIGGTNLRYNSSCSMIRVNIPKNLKLTKYSCDSYSTTSDKRTLDDLGWDVMIWNKNRRRWIIHNELKGINPCDMYAIVSAKGLDTN